MKTYLKPKSPDTKAISVRVPAELLAEFDEARDSAEKHGMTVSLTDLVVTAIREAIPVVKAEVASLGAKNRKELERSVARAGKAARKVEEGIKRESKKEKIIL